jgi:hypothetical protein
MMLKLSIISVDLSLYLNKKRDLYALFHSQEFTLPNTTAKEAAIPNAIIVLEEFDYAVDKLLDIENIFKYKDQIKREYLNMKNKEIKNRANELLNEYDVSGRGEHNERADNAQFEKDMSAAIMGGEEIDYSKFMELEMSRDGLDIVNNKVHEKAKKEIFQKRSFDNEISSINAELNTIIKNMAILYILMLMWSTPLILAIKPIKKSFKINN